MGACTQNVRDKGNTVIVVEHDPCARSATEQRRRRRGCPDCEGAGVIHTDLAFIDGQEAPSEACAGARYRPRCSR